jgi:hypothetical protein
MAIYLIETIDQIFAKTECTKSPRMCYNVIK